MKFLHYIYRNARRIFGETVAVWSGWIWALLPYLIYWSVRWIWETSLTALLLSLAFMLTVEMEGDDRITSWIGFGVLWGVIGLTQSLAKELGPANIRVNAILPGIVEGPRMTGVIAARASSALTRTSPPGVLSNGTYSMRKAKDIWPIPLYSSA